MRTRRTLDGMIAASLLLVVGLAGCASSGTGSGSSGSRDLITLEQLQEHEELDAYDAIRRIRPQWLRTRGTSSIENQGQEGVRVYVDGAPQGGIDALRRMPVRNIQEIRYLDARTATTRYGTNHGDGAIVITTRTG